MTSGIVTGDSGKTPKIGHVQTEWPVTLLRNRRSRSIGMSGHVGAEYTTCWSLQLPQQYLLDLQHELASAAISPDGKTIAVGFANGTLQLWNIVTNPPQTARSELPLEGTSPEKHVFPLAKTFKLRQEIKKAHTAKLKRLTFNPQGTQLASAGFDNIAKLWKINLKGKLVLDKTFDDHVDFIHDVSFSPDGSQLATASYDGKIGLFSVTEDKKTLFDAHQGRIASVSFNSDGTQILTSGIYDFKLKRWNLNTQPPSLIPPVHHAQDKLLWSSLSPDGKWIASVGRGQSKLTLTSINNPNKSQQLPGHEQTIYKALFSPDSRQLATVSWDMTVRLWDLDTQNELFLLRLPTTFDEAPVWDFDFRCTPTRCWIVVPLTNGKLTIYNLGTIDYEK